MHAFLALALLGAAPSLPTWLDGEWDPYSNAFRGLETLTIAHGAFTWHACAGVHADVVAVEENSVTVRFASSSRCMLDDVPPTRMDTVRFTLRDNRCDLGVSIYASLDAAKRNEPSAEGLYGKVGCTGGPPAHAAANLSTTSR